MIIYDDGQGQTLDDLTGVTQRQTIRIHLGSDTPLVGKLLKLEIAYWKPDYPVGHEQKIYEFIFQYDQNGELTSTVDALTGQELTEEFLQNYQPYSLLPITSNLSDSSTISHQDFLDPQNFQESIAFYEIWDTIVSTFFEYFQSFQRSSQYAKTKLKEELHLSSSVTKGLEKISQALIGETTYLLMGSRLEKTRVDCYGGYEIHDKVRVTFINGMLNTRHMMQKSLETISESHGKVKIHYVFRPTEGWTWDISRAIMIRTAFTLGFRSIHAHLLAQMWKRLIQEMGGVEGGGVIVHYAHSLGGSETDRARDLLTPEEQKMIRVVTLGSATLVRSGGFQSVTNIISVNDGVCSFLLEPLGRIRNCFDPDTNLRFYSSFSTAPYWPTDHLLNGPTYGAILRELGKKFLEEFKPKSND